MKKKNKISHEKFAEANTQSIYLSYIIETNPYAYNVWINIFIFNGKFNHIEEKEKQRIDHSLSYLLECHKHFTQTRTHTHTHMIWHQKVTLRYYWMVIMLRKWWNHSFLVFVGRKIKSIKYAINWWIKCFLYE